jgi:hypothetical protein
VNRIAIAHDQLRPAASAFLHPRERNGAAFAEQLAEFPAVPKARPSFLQIG